MGRKQFESVVATAPRRVVKVASVATNLYTSAGSNTTYDFFTAPGTIGRLLNLYVNFKAPSVSITPATSGSHTLIVNNTDGLGGAYAQVDATYANHINVQKLESVEPATKVLPSDKSAFASLLMNATFDDVVGLRFTHVNNTDAQYGMTTANQRIVQFKYEEMQSAR